MKLGAPGLPILNPEQAFVIRVTFSALISGYHLGIGFMERGIMYARTQNENGTYNTRCLHCFMTVASAVETSEELDRLEARHICPEKALAYLQAHEDPHREHAP